MSARTHLRDREGFSLALVLFAIVLLSALALSLSTLTLATRGQTSHDLRVDRAAYVARAAFERTCSDVLLRSTDWSTVEPDPFVGATFDDATFSVGLADRSRDTTRVDVAVLLEGAERDMSFRALRVDASGLTVGVRLLEVVDPTLDVLAH